MTMSSTSGPAFGQPGQLSLGLPCDQEQRLESRGYVSVKD